MRLGVKWDIGLISRFDFPIRKNLWEATHKFLRKDKIDAEFKRIARRYYNIIYSKAVTSGEPLSVEQQDKLMARMDTLADHIRDYEKAGNNVFTRSQARRLDKYLYRKSRQAAGKIGINDCNLRKSAARNRVTYLEKVKES